jgi:hypothetical protein
LVVLPVSVIVTPEFTSPLTVPEMVTGAAPLLLQTMAIRIIIRKYSKT